MMWGGLKRKVMLSEADFLLKSVSNNSLLLLAYQTNLAVPTVLTFSFVYSRHETIC